MAAVKAAYWSAASEFAPSNIDANLYTHLFCAFANLNTTNTVVISSTYGFNIENFSNFVKQNNPQVKTLLSISGDANLFSSMVITASTRKSFIDSSIATARRFNFDGLDLHWLYPSTADDMDHLRELLNEWRDAILQESRQVRKAELLLVQTVFYLPYRGSATYPTQSMRRNLDWVNVAAYNLYTPNSSQTLTGPTNALFNRNVNRLSADFGIKAWIREGLGANAIVFGISFLGWAWRLDDANQAKLFSPAAGPAQGTDISPQGSIEYRNIKKRLTPTTVVELDRQYVISFVNFGTTWIGFDDEDSITSKIWEAKKLGLHGYFLWHLAADDDSFYLSAKASTKWDS